MGQAVPYTSKVMGEGEGSGSVPRALPSDIQMGLGDAGISGLFSTS